LFPAILERAIASPESGAVPGGPVWFKPVVGRFHGDSQLLKYYVFWGLFALVLIGIGISLWDRHRRSQKVKAMEAAYRAAAAVPSAKPAVGPAAEPARSPLEAGFDPNATRIHFRASSAGTSSALPNRGAAPLPAEKTPRLVCVGGSQRDHSFPVTVAGIRVGRDPTNDIVISDPRASYHHAWIGIIDHKAVLRDLGSTNGTFLNARIDSPVSEVVLIPGDTVFFGGHGGDQFRFVLD
jgi:hypothetical protein